jgi:hypothetical protein
MKTISCVLAFFCAVALGAQDYNPNFMVQEVEYTLRASIDTSGKVNDIEECMKCG